MRRRGRSRDRPVGRDRGTASARSRGTSGDPAAEIARGALFHEPGNAAELADRLSQLIADPALRASLGAEGREAAVRMFDRPRLCGTLIPIYESLAPSQ